ncbi:hypothetical protein NE237_022447 [Protea cynaroides]|uniref:Uncharacterized protein n=1 Tax=Protea cynaroides TaxID=273540 RepID=A0A9Q0K5U4_9MAGN|nr:hypothetical protein NE237_022447 [Protea cynaroides]
MLKDAALHTSRSTIGGTQKILLRFCDDENPHPKHFKEGGYGACVVLQSKYNPVLEQVEEFTVSSCQTLVCSLNGRSITTTEGLGNNKSRFHPSETENSGST